MLYIGKNTQHVSLARPTLPHACCWNQTAEVSTACRGGRQGVCSAQVALSTDPEAWQECRTAYTLYLSILLNRGAGIRVP